MESTGDGLSEGAQRTGREGRHSGALLEFIEHVRERTVVATVDRSPASFRLNRVFRPTSHLLAGFHLMPSAVSTMSSPRPSPSSS